MSEFTLTFYELQKTPELSQFWPLHLPAETELAEQIEFGELNFEDDLAEPVEDWAEDVFLSQYIVQLDLDAFYQAEQAEALFNGLEHGLVFKARDLDFISAINNGQISEMIDKLLQLNLSGWDLDDDRAKEEAEVADFIGFLAACKMRGHSLLGVAVNT